MRRIWIAIGGALALIVGSEVVQGRDQAAPHGQGDIAEYLCDDAPARFAGWLAYAEARITPTLAQRPAWDGFARAAAASTRPIAGWCAQRQPTTTADATLEARAAFLRAEMEALGLMLPAVRSLLPVLEPGQRDLLTTLLTPPMPPFPPPGFRR